MRWASYHRSTTLFVFSNVDLRLMSVSLDIRMAASSAYAIALTFVVLFSSFNRRTLTGWIFQERMTSNPFFALIDLPHQLRIFFLLFTFLYFSLQTFLLFILFYFVQDHFLFQLKELTELCIMNCQFRIETHSVVNTFSIVWWTNCSKQCFAKKNFLFEIFWVWKL